MAENVSKSPKSRYYGVYIPSENTPDRNGQAHLRVYTQYPEVGKIMKDNKKARFMVYPYEEDAVEFALHGSSGGPGNPQVSESTSFKSLKSQDLCQLRKYIESNDVEKVKQLITENPRYLVGIGDTPTILQEGPRYNALHICAKSNNSKIADYILTTISDRNFSRLLYGVDSEKSYLERHQVLVDLYLNTPDKVLNETPLHFASKFGALDVVKVFVSYPQCQKELKNKYNQIPKDITCSRYTKVEKEDITDLVNEINSLLGDLYFVPVWRSEDEAVPPIIGSPFSPKSPVVPPSVDASPLSPTMEIKAVAGPMKLTEASEFHKTWKTPKKVRSFSGTPSPSARLQGSCTPHPIHGLLSRAPLQKRLESVGRSLARERSVKWSEYWPFLNAFVDLASKQGLDMLEKYLKSKILVTVMTTWKENMVKPQNKNNIDLTPVSNLCEHLRDMSLSGKKEYSMYKELPNEYDNPYLSMDTICYEFGIAVACMLSEACNTERYVESLNEVAFMFRNLSCNEVFVNFPLNKIHGRIATWIMFHLNKSNTSYMSIQKIFKSVRERVCGRNNHLTNGLSNGNNNNLNTKLDKTSIACICDTIIRRSSSNNEVFSTNDPTCENEEQFMSMMKSESECSCFSSISNVAPQKKITSEVKRKILFNCNDKWDSNEKAKLGNGNINSNVPDSKNDDWSSNDSEEFVTPCGSCCSSDDDEDEPMQLATEAPGIFISGHSITQLDYAVLQALDDVEIEMKKYPSIYRWKHSVIFEKERLESEDKCGMSSLNGSFFY